MRRLGFSGILRAGQEGKGSYPKETCQAEVAGVSLVSRAEGWLCTSCDGKMTD